jgi:hypothetical protein
LNDHHWEFLAEKRVVRVQWYSQVQLSRRVEQSQQLPVIQVLPERGMKLIDFGCAQKTFDFNGNLFVIACRCDQLLGPQIHQHFVEPNSSFKGLSVIVQPSFSSARRTAL